MQDIVAPARRQCYAVRREGQNANPSTLAGAASRLLAGFYVPQAHGSIGRAGGQRRAAGTERQAENTVLAADRNALMSLQQAQFTACCHVPQTDVIVVIARREGATIRRERQTADCIGTKGTTNPRFLHGGEIEQADPFSPLVYGEHSAVARERKSLNTARYAQFALAARSPHMNIARACTPSRPGTNRREGDRLNTFARSQVGSVQG